jgi:hypothetical protein
MVGRVQSIAPAGDGAMHLKVSEGHLKRLHETHRIDVGRGVTAPTWRQEAMRSAAANDRPAISLREIDCSNILFGHKLRRRSLTS